MSEFVYRVHAVRRMFERGITNEEVETVIRNGTVIEDYPDDRPCPSRLVSGRVEDRPLHVVVADCSEEQVLIVVTVYEPDPERWSDDLRRRR